MSEFDKIWCSGCHTFKPASEFYSNKSKKNGKQDICKECSKKSVKLSAERAKQGVKLSTGRKSVFSEETVKEMKEYRKAGFTYREIAEIVGAKENTVASYFTHRCTVEERTPKKKEKKSISDTLKKEMFNQYKQTINNNTKETAMSPKTNTATKNTLNDFQPRDLIKHLYNLGYRIENNQLIVKQTVNIKDIING